MKSNFYKFKITFAIIFGTLLSISPFNPVRLTNPKDTLEVCAQDIDYNDLGTGLNCVNNYAQCTDAGYSNLAQGVSALRYFEDINSGLLLKGLKTALGSKANSACYLNGYENVIVKWLHENDIISNGGICAEDPTKAYQDSNGVIPFDKYRQLLSDDLNSCQYVMPTKKSGSLYAVGAFCPSGWRSSQAGNRATNFVGFYAGCCPADYSFTNHASGAFGSGVYYRYGVCCKIVDGVKAKNIPDGTLSCNYNDEFTLNDTVVGEFNTIEQAMDAVARNNPVLMAGFIKNAAGKYVSITDPTQIFNTNDILNNSDDLFRPQYGIEMTFNGGSADINYSVAAVAEKNCPSSTSCALVKNLGGTSFLTNPDFLNEEVASSLSCTRCFATGEPISVNSATNQMNVCDPTNTETYTRSVALCNSSVIDTIACLGGSNSTSQNANSDGVGSTNYDLCCACRVQGGVWTGIGCTDTTPAGLITGLIRIVYGVMGGVALIMLIYAGIMYQTGNEANVKQARESIIRTITGLIVLTFSILILRIIGINVLDILPSGSI